MTLLPIRPVEPMMRIRGFFVSWYWVDMVAFSSFGLPDEDSQGREQLGGSSQPDPVSATARGSPPRPAFTRGGVARLHSTSVFGRAFAVRVSRRHVPTRGEADSDAETPLLRLVEALVQGLLGIGQAPQRRRPGGQRIGAIT